MRTYALFEKIKTNLLIFRNLWCVLADRGGDCACTDVFRTRRRGLCDFVRASFIDGLLYRTLDREVIVTSDLICRDLPVKF